MARIELRDATIRIKDGFGGSAAVDDLAIAGGNTTVEIDTVAALTNDSTIVPVGARFSIAGVATPNDGVFTVTDQNANQQYTLLIEDATGGNYDLVVDGEAVDDVAYNADAAALETAIEGVVGAGNVQVTGSAPFLIEFIGDLEGEAIVVTLDDTDLTGSGGEAGTLTELHEGGTTWELTFTPAFLMADLPSDDDVITFLPQQIEVKIGEGNLTYTESKEYEYELDRGNLDSVREGNEVPMEVNLEFVYEFVRTGTSEAISPVDALKGIGGAAGWVSSAADACEPYAVDVEVEHNPPCGTDQTETTTFPDFRRDSLEFDLSAATIACTGRCNASEPTIVRG
jgi:hypothetical protein